MKKKVIYFLMFTLIAILQLSFLPVIFSGNITVNAILMMMLAWSILDGFAIFLSWTIFFGLFYDFISYSAVGTHGLIFLAVVYFVSFFSKRFLMEFKGVGLILFLLFIIFATLTSHAILALTLALKLGMINNFWNLFGSVNALLIELLYNAIIFPVCFLLIKKTKQFFALTTNTDNIF